MIGMNHVLKAASGTMSLMTARHLFHNVWYSVCMIYYSPNYTFLFFRLQSLEINSEKKSAELFGSFECLISHLASSSYKKYIWLTSTYHSLYSRALYFGAFLLSPLYPLSLCKKTPISGYFPLSKVLKPIWN